MVAEWIQIDSLNCLFIGLHSDKAYMVNFLPNSHDFRPAWYVCHLLQFLSC